MSVICRIPFMAPIALCALFSWPCLILFIQSQGSFTETQFCVLYYSYYLLWSKSVQNLFDNTSLMRSAPFQPDIGTWLWMLKSIVKKRLINIPPLKVLLPFLTLTHAFFFKYVVGNVWNHIGFNPAHCWTEVDPGKSLEGSSGVVAPSFNFGSTQTKCLGDGSIFIQAVWSVIWLHGLLPHWFLLIS